MNSRADKFPFARKLSDNNVTAKYAPGAGSLSNLLGSRASPTSFNTSANSSPGNAYEDPASQVIVSSTSISPSPDFSSKSVSQALVSDEANAKIRVPLLDAVAGQLNIIVASDSQEKTQAISEDADENEPDLLTPTRRNFSERSLPTSSILSSSYSNSEDYINVSSERSSLGSSFNSTSSTQSQEFSSRHSLEISEVESDAEKTPVPSACSLQAPWKAAKSDILIRNHSNDTLTIFEALKIEPIAPKNPKTKAAPSSDVLYASEIQQTRKNDSWSLRNSGKTCKILSLLPSSCRAAKSISRLDESHKCETSKAHTSKKKKLNRKPSVFGSYFRSEKNLSCIDDEDGCSKKCYCQGTFSRFPAKPRGLMARAKGAVKNLFFCCGSPKMALSCCPPCVRQRLGQKDKTSTEKSKMSEVGASASVPSSMVNHILKPTIDDYPPTMARNMNRPKKCVANTMLPRDDYAMFHRNLARAESLAFDRAVEQVLLRRKSGSDAQKKTASVSRSRNDKNLDGKAAGAFILTRQENSEQTLAESVCICLQSSEKIQTSISSHSSDEAGGQMIVKGDIEKNEAALPSLTSDVGGDDFSAPCPKCNPNATRGSPLHHSSSAPSLLSSSPNSNTELSVLSSSSSLVIPVDDMLFMAANAGAVAFEGYLQIDLPSLRPVFPMLYAVLFSSGHLALAYSQTYESFLRVYAIATSAKIEYLDEMSSLEAGGESSVFAFTVNFDTLTPPLTFVTDTSLNRDKWRRNIIKVLEELKLAGVILRNDKKV